MNSARVIELDNRGKTQMFFDDIYNKIASKKQTCDPDCNCKKCRARRQRRNLSTQKEQMQYEAPIIENEMQDTSSFDAKDTILGAEDRYADVAPTKVVVNPQVQDTANKLVWNKMLIDKLTRERGHRNDKQNISIIIIERKKRMRELKDALDNYSNAVGEEYASFDDMQLQCKCRKIEVAKALKNAKDKAEGRYVGNDSDLVVVDEKLKPKIGDDKIVIPAKEGKSNATGLNAIDNIDDVDAPPIREMFVNADGSRVLNINWGSFLIGGVVAIGALWAIKKYNLLKGL